MLATAMLSILGGGAFAVNRDLFNEYPATSLHGQTAALFAGTVEEKTGGSLTVTVHHGAAPSHKSVDLFDAAGDGALEAASTSFVFLPGIDPAFQLGPLPFIAADMEETATLNELARPIHDGIVEDANRTLLVVVPCPVSGTRASKAVAGPENMKGLKIRTYDVGSTEAMASAGAFPVQISWSDVPAQLSTNAIEAVLTPADGGASAQFRDLQLHFTNVNHTAGLQAVHVNRDAMDALTEAFGWQLAVDSLLADYKTCDPELLHRAFENVLRNALHYFPGAGSVEVTAASVGTAVEIAVANTGLVVDEGPEDAAQAGLVHAGAGPGLGLTIAANTLRLHGDSIRAANRPGGSLVVTCAVPLTSG